MSAPDDPIPTPPAARWEAPLDRARQLTRRTLGWFPIRVWRHFLQHNGFLLAAGVSYQALFSMFALFYVVFASAGLWLGGRAEEVVPPLIAVINGYVPGLITEDAAQDGLFTTDQAMQVATSGIGTLAVTGAIALGTAIWTAIGFITFARRAVRDIFGIDPDRRSYVLLKARDFLAAAIFAILLLLGAALASVGTWAIGLLFRLLGWSRDSEWYQWSVQFGSIIVGFVVFAVAIGALLRFLIGISLSSTLILPGSLLGGGAMIVLNLGAGLLLSYTPTNPLLATFAIFVGLLLWFRLTGIILLVASSWVAVSAQDQHADLVPLTEDEIRRREHEAQLEAAHERLRLAVDARRDGPWWRSRRLGRDVREALDALGELEDPPDPSAAAGPGRDVSARQ